jgi:hypothetical protein
MQGDYGGMKRTVAILGSHHPQAGDTARVGILRHMNTAPLLVPVLAPTVRLLLLLLVALPAWAQLRPLPDNAERGFIRHVQETIVSIDGRKMRLAPGATIRNQQNMIVVPMSLPPEGAVAEYQVDPQGQIARVWLLTPEERKRPRKPRR